MCCETKLYLRQHWHILSMAVFWRWFTFIISTGIWSVLHSSLTLWPLHCISSLHWKTNKKMLLSWNSQVPFVVLGQIVRTQGCLSRGGAINQVDPLWDTPLEKGKILTTGRTWHYRALLPWCVGLAKVTKISDEDCLPSCPVPCSLMRQSTAVIPCLLCPHTTHWYSFLAPNVSKRYWLMIK